MANLLKVKSIRSSKYESNKFILLPLYFLSKNNKRQVVCGKIDCKLYLVNGLRANIFVGNNIFGTKQILIDIEKKLQIVEFIL